MKFQRLFLFALCVAFVGSAAISAQEAAAPQSRVFVNFVSANKVVVTPGHSSPVLFTFQVQEPYHINSSQPLAEELIPTQLHFSLPSEVALGKMQYPTGKLMSFPFDPSTRLSVYSGNFVIKGMVVAPTAASSGTYTIHGELRYQACDNNACYPPKKLPFTFDVKVGSAAKAGPRAHPTATSPHIHG